MQINLFLILKTLEFMDNQNRSQQGDSGMGSQQNAGNMGKSGNQQNTGSSRDREQQGGLGSSSGSQQGSQQGRSSEEEGGLGRSGQQGGQWGSDERTSSSRSMGSDLEDTSEEDDLGNEYLEDDEDMDEDRNSESGSRAGGGI